MADMSFPVHSTFFRLLVGLRFAIYSGLDRKTVSQGYCPQQYRPSEAQHVAGRNRRSTHNVSILIAFERKHACTAWRGGPSYEHRRVCRVQSTTEVAHTQKNTSC
ncbi:hypothetical protein L798_08752 [Zootermopsis nevadensis]|uniref:Secreted protein n=1 Tax=Zootermopsis nevadensis TaxID=136037 RepID=A0A067RT81_ZOONE|nr:hypothetical protein L798_08752 [Zootermopsis nevadensis]